MEKYYAHTSSHGNEPLIDHLTLVSILAERYGSTFECGDICKLIGSLHDIGKHTEKFRKVLSHDMIKIDHAIVGVDEVEKITKYTEKLLSDNSNTQKEH